MQLPLELKNRVITAFYLRYVKDKTQSYGLKVEMSPDAFTLEELVHSERLSEDSARLLQRVGSLVGNYQSFRGTPEENSWFQFIESCVENKLLLDLDLLRKVLTQIYGVNEDVALNMSHDYERLTRFLQHYLGESG